MKEKELKEAIKAGQTYRYSYFGSHTSPFEKTVNYEIPSALSSREGVYLFVLVFSTFMLGFFLFLLASLIIATALGSWILPILIPLGVGLFVAYFLFFPSLVAQYTSPVKSWILTNIKCPACKGKIKSCACKVALAGKSSRYFYEVQCGDCIRKFVFMQWGNSLMLVEEISGMRYKPKQS